MSRNKRFRARLAGLACLMIGCAVSNMAAADDGSPGVRSAAPAMIYVADFELDAADVKSESILPRVLPRPRLSGPLGLRQDPQAQARHVIDLMAQSIVEDLTKAGLAAQRRAPGVALPSVGWLVRGVFLEVDEGNRLRRATIGFGAGSTSLQVAAATDDLSRGRLAPLYQVDERSGHMPGAVVTMNPVFAGVRFVLAGHDLDRNVKEAAGKIAKDVEQRVRGATAPSRP